MCHFRSFRRAFVFLAGLSLLFAATPLPAAAQNAGVKSTYVDKLAPTEERQRVRGELLSGDPQRIAAAKQEIRECTFMKGHPNPWDLEILDRAGLAEEVEPLAIEGILKFAVSGETIAAFELARVRSFTAQRKFDDALAAAKAYYNLVRLKDTSKAITVVSAALGEAHPDDPDIAARFKAQQMAGMDQPAGQPPATQPDLGPPILASIHVDASPFEEAIQKTNGQGYPDLDAKANLLLAADRCKEARAVFESAMNLAGPTQLPMAVENVARAIRAETGSIGPANAYLASLSKQQASQAQ